MSDRKNCVLAYSGGLDTTAIVVWLREQGYDVHAVLVDVGQEEDVAALCDKAMRLGAKTAVARDARPLMCNAVLPYAAGLAATYEGTYRLGTALARPFIALEQVRRARELGGATLAHGATGKGNDQIRFEFAYRSLAPEMPVVAPWKIWDLSGRKDLIDYIRAHGIEDDFELTKTYSMDENLWHLSVEGGALEDPAADLDVEAVLAAVASRFAGGVPTSTSHARSSPRKITVEFRHGVPVALDGAALEMEELVSTLNHHYRAAPWAWDLVIENRFTGIKSRGLYINPAAKLLHTAADGLARTCLNKPLYDHYCQLGRDYGATIYRGEYFSDQRVVLERAADAVMAHLTGSVCIDLAHSPFVAKIEAPSAMFSQRLATFEKSTFSHNDADGFIRLAWLTAVGRSAPELANVHPVETKHATASDLCTGEQQPARRLVPAAV